MFSTYHYIIVMVIVKFIVIVMTFTLVVPGVHIGLDMLQKSPHKLVMALENVRFKLV